MKKSLVLLLTAVLVILPSCGKKVNKEAVTVLLEGLARRDHALATYNLGVMAENRGEKILAARRYAEAKVLEKNTGSDSE